jgi:nitrogen fixation/metabolism regulation signal transduction histidine kinase
VKRRLRSRFRLLTVVQVLALGGTLSLMALTLYESNTIAVPVVLAGIVLVQVIALLSFVQAHVDALEEFFAAVNYEDFTRRFIEDEVDAELKQAFNAVLSRFQDARADRDLKAGYLDTVVRHVPVPFIAARADGSLSLVNNPARRLTGLPGLARLTDLAAIDDSLPAVLESIEAGQRRMIQTALRGVPVELRVSVAEIRMAGEVERLYSIENLSGELTARESTAWRNLIRVLTHEIMNTLTPVTSLAQTTTSMLDDPDAADDIREAIATIGRRSEGLINFVSRYRELLKVPKPAPDTLGVAALLREITTLMQADFDGIAFDIDVNPPSLEIYADRQLVEQVLINLVRNAAEAIGDRGDARITLTAGFDLGRSVLAVRDNGPGIPDDALEQVFIPFYTTKGDGSGIGLSLCRQIMTAHGGDIAIDTDSSGTTVRLVFR